MAGTVRRSVAGCVFYVKHSAGETLTYVKLSYKSILGFRDCSLLILTFVLLLLLLLLFGDWGFTL